MKRLNSYAGSDDLIGKFLCYPFYNEIWPNARENDLINYLLCAKDSSSYSQCLAILTKGQEATTIDRACQQVIYFSIFSKNKFYCFSLVSPRKDV